VRSTTPTSEPLTPVTTPTHTSAMTEPTTKVSLFDEVAALNPLTAARVRTKIERLQNRIEELESCGATTTSTRGQRPKFLASFASSKGWRLIMGSDGPIIARTFHNLDAAEMWLESGDA